MNALSEGILPNATVYIAGLPCDNITADVNETTTVGNISFFPPLYWNTTGYQNLTVFNADGGVTVGVDVMFFTNDCPFVGTRELRLSFSFLVRRVSLRHCFGFLISDYLY